MSVKKIEKIFLKGIDKRFFEWYNPNNNRITGCDEDGGKVLPTESRWLVKTDGALFRCPSLPSRKPESESK